MLRTHPPPPPGEDARPSPSVPPLPPTSETASASSDVSHTPPPHHSEHHRPYSSQDTAASAADRQPSASSSSSSWYHTSPVDAHERLPPLQSNTRVSRTDSLAASDSSGASASPLSRKPVSSTVSPLTTYSTAASPAVSQEQQFQKPDAGFSRNFLVDSPTLYEFPHKPAGTSTAAFSAAVPAIHGVQSAS